MGWLTIAIALLTTLPAQDHSHGTPTERLGTVNFQTSCSAAAQPTFNRAVALLHSFEFSRAVDAFNATLQTDPSCAMAQWGIALSRWGNPFAAGFETRRAAATGPRRDYRGPVAGAEDRARARLRRRRGAPLHEPRAHRASRADQGVSRCHVGARREVSGRR